MASPGELIDAIAKATGSPRARVFSAHRYLREAGFITKGGRGTSAAKMTAKDAAHLLIATASVVDIKDSPKLIERPGSLVSPDGEWKLQFGKLPTFTDLPHDHSFAQAIEALIKSAAGGELQALADELEGSPGSLETDTMPSLNVLVSVLGPIPSGVIMIEQIEVDQSGDAVPHPDQFWERHRYDIRRTHPESGNLSFVDVARPAEMDADLKTVMTFSHRTLAAIGAVLSSDH
ncbi:MAG: uncharacterized protein JWQ22_1758 [Devosia sp.]|nr:uncharacterized protein [Devosia sp.]